MTNWTKDILIDLADDQRPEWCEICADLDVEMVPARAVMMAGGACVCSDCAESWHEMAAKEGTSQ